VFGVIDLFCVNVGVVLVGGVEGLGVVSEGDWV